MTAGAARGLLWSSADTKAMFHATYAVLRDTRRRPGELVGARIAGLEDDLAAARTSLRRMIRSENLPAP